MSGPASLTRKMVELLDAQDLHLASLSQPSFGLLVENTADGVLVVDLEGAVLYANPAAADIFGQAREQLLHVPLGRPVVSGETAEITVHRPGRPSAEVEMRVVEVTWDGRPGLLASLRDVSARRVQEERQRQSQKLEAIGRLAAGITHDFNNLLAAIEAGMRLLQKQLAEDPTHPRVETLIRQMLARMQNGSALTQQLLAFARRQTLSPQLTDLNERIKSLTDLLAGTLGNGIEVRTDLDPGLGPVPIDVNQFEIAVLNLAVNARDATAGSGIVTIETSNAPGDIFGIPNTAASFVRVSVRDTGCGMSKETLDRVFEPFFTTKDAGHGTGLGLSQVYGFITQSGGHIRLESEIGRGAAVHLYLPRFPSYDA